MAARSTSPLPSSNHLPLPPPVPNIFCFLHGAILTWHVRCGRGTGARAAPDRHPPCGTCYLHGVRVVSAVQVHVRLRVDALHVARDVHQVRAVPRVVQAHLPRRRCRTEQMTMSDDQLQTESNVCRENHRQFYTISVRSDTGCGHQLLIK